MVAQPPATPNRPPRNAQHGSEASVGESGFSRAREHLANERTYLAWLRTCSATMALGLAAAKFGSRSVVYAVSAGGLLVCAAMAVFGYATFRYRTITEEIAHGRFTVSSRGPITAALALVLAVLAALVLLIQ